MIENSRSNINKLSLKISFFGAFFLAVFMSLIAVFSYIYFFVGELRELNNESSSEAEITPTFITDIIISNSYRIDATGSHIFELTRDSMIIGQNGEDIITNGIFSYESFPIDELTNRRAGVFYKAIGEKIYLLKKVVGDDNQIIFAKDTTYIYLFALQMLRIGLIASLIFFVLAFLFIRYSINLFVRPINEYNTKLKEYNHNLAHEIKTPLTVLNMNLELIDTPNSDIIESNKEEIDKIKNITDSLLFLSENFVLREIQNIELNSLLKSFVEKSQKSEYIDIEYYKRDINVLANKNMLERLLKNLSENAYKYGSDRRLKIIVTHEKLVFKNSLHKEFKPGEIDKIFEAFYRADNEGIADGHGLGLTLVKRIVDLLKWRIEVISEGKQFGIEISFIKA